MRSVAPFASAMTTRGQALTKLHGGANAEAAATVDVLAWPAGEWQTLRRMNTEGAMTNDRSGCRADQSARRVVTTGAASDEPSLGT
jgi:hypothetical protein